MRNALITGAGRGLGRHLAVDLAGGGCRVVVHYRRDQEAALETARLVEVAGGEAVVVGADLTNTADVDAMAVGLHEKLGHLDILINNVGGFIIRHVDELSMEEFSSVLEATAVATFNATKAFLPLLRESEHGRIVNIADSGADVIRAVPKSLPYYIGKTGVLIMTKTFAVTEADRGITVNAVMPGVLENSITYPPLEKIPAHRLGKLEDVASAVRFLISPDADYVTGSYVQVGGGWNL